ncbi:hypothetical protein LCGC14_2052350, partial [marine sediment metagenome]
GRMPKEDLCGAHTHNALDDAVEQAQMVEGWQKKYGDDSCCLITAEEAYATQD